MWVDRAAGIDDLDNVLASHSLNREALKGHLALYRGRDVRTLAAEPGGEGGDRPRRLGHRLVEGERRHR